MPRNPASSHNLDTEVSLDMIRRTSLLMAVAAGIVVLASLGMLSGAEGYSRSSLTYPSALLSLTGWIIFALSYRLDARMLANFLIYCVQLVALFSLYAFGSVRGAGSVLFLATMVAAGIFLGQRALIISLLTGVIALGVVTYAELAGAIAPKSLQVSVITWFTHVAVLTCVAMAVYYARQRTRDAYEEQFQALEENKRLASERDRSLEHFTRIFRTNPSPMIAQAANSAKIIDVNPAFERCYGYSKSEVLGKSDYMLWAKPEQREKHLEELKRNHRAEQFNVSGLRSDGSHFDGHIRSELGNETEDSLVITTVTDMTEQHATQRRLSRSEERFSKAFNFSPLNLIITRLSDDTVIEINRSPSEAQLAPQADAHGQPASQAGPWFTADNRDAFFSRLMAEGHLHGIDAVLKRPDGSTIEAKVWAEPIEIEEEACVLTCIVDTTDEKRRETMLRDIARGMSGRTAQDFFNALTVQVSRALGADMVLIGELSGLETVNTLSVSRRGEAAANFAFSIRGKLCERSLRQRDPVVLGGGASEDDKWNHLKDETTYESGLCQALHDDSGSPIGLLNALWIPPVEPTSEMLALMAIFASRANAEMMRLQSERTIEQLNETLEQRVQNRTAELSKLNAELDSFAYSISHDLKSPLRAIDGFTQLLSERLEGRLDEEEQQLMGRVLGATHRMATLMADLLALARVSQLPMKRERINLSQLADEVFSQAEKREPRRNVCWRVEPSVYAEGDRELVRTVLMHLIDNALKYTRDQAEPLIEFGQMRGGPLAEHGSNRRFFVRDNGVGFSMEHGDKLFKPFQRLHMPSAGFDGTGIGLATVRRIVERHGGAISGTGSPGLGARFEFALEPSNIAQPVTP